MTKVYIGFIESLMILGLAVMVALTFTSTVIRFLGYGGIFWAEEVTRYVSIWVVFLGAGLGVRYGIHLGVDILISEFPLPLQRVAFVASCLLMMVFEIVLIYYGAQLTLSNYAQQSASLRLPMAYPNAAVPVGASIMLYETMRLLILELRNKRREAPVLVN